MTNKQLTRYQESAVNELILKSKLLLDKDINKKTLVFQAPTGSGKTFMMSQFIKQAIEKFDDQNLCFLWVSIGKGSLQVQSYKSLKEEFEYSPPVYLLEQEFFGSRKTISRDEVIVVNWEKLVNKNKKTGEWKNILMKDKETINFRELIRNTKEEKIKIIMIIDESHVSAKAERAIELREIIEADLTIEMSATPVLKDGEYNEKVEVNASDVISEGMIKKEIIVNENLKTIMDNEIDSQSLVLGTALAKRIELKKYLEKENSEVNPLVLIQLPTGEEGQSKKKAVEKFLAEKNITEENKKLAIWLTEEKINLEVLENNLNEVEFLIFKQAIDTGWDCPRAQILVKFRQTKSEVFELQTIGRILRMPEAIHYQNDKLNKAFIYTNIKSKNIDFKGNEISLKNAIKSLYVERESIYKPIKLKSYYRNRVDFGDLTMSFRGVFEEVFCEYFGIKKDKANFGMFEKNRKKLESKGIKFKNLENKDEIVINGEIDVKYFDNLPEGKIKFDDNFLARLSENDFENAFKNIIKENLNGFAPARSIGIFKEALIVWFKKYLGIDPRKNNGMIFVKNIIFNNYGIFGKLFDEATRTYKPIKDKEIEKKIEETEEWNKNWEISENRNYNPNSYKSHSYALSLYKSPNNKKTYLSFDSAIEKDFVEFLEKNKNKILWWWQNGNEHMALNFGIKYNTKSTFQPDFLVMFKNGQIGIYDTKASGFQEDDNKLKGEALQKYIREENKRKKKKLLIGGLIIKEGKHFRINSDDKYKPFKFSSVKGKDEKYKGDDKIKKGWRYLEF
ncbi:MAG: DEAD/DEAH box helicase family protein [Candidatus Nealsonbacteria bacterium]